MHIWRARAASLYNGSPEVPSCWESNWRRLLLGEELLLCVEKGNHLSYFGKIDWAIEAINPLDCKLCEDRNYMLCVFCISHCV